MVKRIRRATSGTSAVERICSSDAAPGAPASAPSVPMSLALFHEWETSKQLAAALASHGRDANMDVAAALASITSVKALSGTPRDNLRLCLAYIRAVNGFKTSITSLRATPFDAADASHEVRLQALWAALQPGHSCERISSAWGDVGFQAKDPKSDFRGGGLLGLEQMLFFATTRPVVARRMIVEPEIEEAQYPWACAGINVTIKASITARDAAEKAFHVSKASSWSRMKGTSEPSLLPIEVLVELDGHVLHMFTQCDVKERVKHPESVGAGICRCRSLPETFGPAIAALIRRRLFHAGIIPPPPPLADGQRSGGAGENLRFIKIVCELDDDGQTQLLRDSFE